MSDAQEPVVGQHKKMGRPSIYTPELAAELCYYLSMGESLRTACKHKGMPTVKTVFLWLSASNKAEWRDDFLQQYTRAKEEAADAMAEEILYIADTPKHGVEKVTKANGVTEIKEGDMLGHRRLQIDTRKFIMAKMKPKKYGDKVDLTSGGEKIGVTVTPEQAEQLLRLRAQRAAANSEANN